jgi:signal transduction histidine kinase
MRLLGFLNLKGIGGQIAALVVASIIALHAIITIGFLINRPDRPEPFSQGEPHQLEMAARLLGAAPPAERPRLLDDLNGAYPQLGLESLPPQTRPVSIVANAAADHGFLHKLMRHLGKGYRVFSLASDAHRIGIALPDGDAISTKMSSPPRQPPFWGGPWIMTLLFAVISVTLLGLWAARALGAPLSSFAKAAEDFSLNGTAAPLAERGPEEVRAVARALNRMRERITTLIDDRTKMLAAISHDLRTPITRLRLRSEFIEDEAQRSRMLADLDQMRSMLEAVLSFLQNDRRGEAMTLTDIASSLQLITDQFADMGHNVTYAGPDHAVAVVRPDDLHRCVTNIAENAARFGKETTIRLTMSGEGAAIEIEDDGPGISDAAKQTMLQPFVRGDDARNMDEAEGFGLGLSIARAIALAHGGELSLHDRLPHGLVVRMEFSLRTQGERRSA